MPDDPIVTEVRLRREELLRASGGDLEALVRFLREQEAKAARKSTQLAPKMLSADRAGH